MQSVVMLSSWYVITNDPYLKPPLRRIPFQEQKGLSCVWMAGSQVNPAAKQGALEWLRKCLLGGLEFAPNPQLGRS